MKTKKMSNLLRSIAFFLTGVILVCTFGFTADGWTQNKTENPTPQAPSQNDKIPDISDTPQPPPAEIPPEIFYNRLTGLVTTEDLSSKAPIAYIMDKNAPSFGLFGSDIIIDIPTEKRSGICSWADCVIMVTSRICNNSC